MWLIFKYSFKDMIRAKWIIVYLLFYLLLGLILLFLNNDLSSSVITIMNIIIILTPLIGTLFGVMFYYNSREFTELLIAQPIRRSRIFMGQYLGVSLSLSLSLVIGLGLPFLIFGLANSAEIFNFIMLIFIGMALTFSFTGLSMWISLRNSNRIKGFGYSVLLWLFFAVIYDGIFLSLLLIFENYPIDQFSLLMSMLNPIDLSRILVLIKLDISALMGYTGAVFQTFFGSNWGIVISGIMLLLWMTTPAYMMVRSSKRRDF